MTGATARLCFGHPSRGFQGPEVHGRALRLEVARFVSTLPPGAVRALLGLPRSVVEPLIRHFSGSIGMVANLILLSFHREELVTGKQSGQRARMADMPAPRQTLTV